MADGKPQGFEKPLGSWLTNFWQTPGVLRSTLGVLFPIIQAVEWVWDEAAAPVGTTELNRA